MHADTLAFSPKRIPFLHSVLPKLSILEVKDDDCKNDTQNCKAESDEKKKAKNLFRTSKYRFKTFSILKCKTFT